MPFGERVRAEPKRRSSAKRELPAPSGRPLPYRGTSGWRVLQHRARRRTPPYRKTSILEDLCRVASGCEQARPKRRSSVKRELLQWSERAYLSKLTSS